MKVFLEDHNLKFFSIFAIIIFLIVIDINGLFTRQEILWSAYYINSDVSKNELEELIVEFSKTNTDVALDKTNIIFDSNLKFSTAHTAVGDYDQMAKLTALIAAKEIDFVISDEETLSHYVSLGGFIELSNVENIVDLKGKDGSMAGYAIDLTLTALNSENKSRLLGAIPLNSKNKEISEMFIDYLLK